MEAMKIGPEKCPKCNQPTHPHGCPGPLPRIRATDMSDTREAEDAIALHGFGQSDADQLTVARREIEQFRSALAAANALVYQKDDELQKRADIEARQVEEFADLRAEVAHLTNERARLVRDCSEARLDRDACRKIIRDIYCRLGLDGFVKIIASAEAQIQEGRIPF